jgi:hypothetical protein
VVRHDSGPRRSESVDAYLWGTRALAALALFALIGGVLSDALAGNFWTHHALLAGLASSVIVVMLTVALVNEAVERRSRQRWSVLAQYVMLQLVRDARLVWTGVAALAGLMPAGERAPAGEVFGSAASIDAASAAVRDTERLTVALGELVADADKQKRLRAEIGAFVEQNDAVLGRWAAVMLNADAYAEILDRHVELAGDLTWLSSLLERDASEHDDRARRRRSHPAAMIEGPLTDEQLVQRMVAITQLAEQLDRGTLAFALKVVPIEWWREQLGAPATALADQAPFSASDANR